MPKTEINKYNALKTVLRMQNQKDIRKEAQKETLAGNLNLVKIEEEILEFWKSKEIYRKAKAKNKGKEKFYFLDGPPYTSGKVHLGTAWNKVLKDCILRYKRMKGFDVWDRAGYDMHGLPAEQGVEKKLNLKKDDIPKFGIANFVNECREFSLTNLDVMNRDFIRLGVWMDFEHAYQSISPEFIEGVWWLIKKAHEKKRLYKGLRTVHWDFEHQTALAKHELEYKTVKDNSIFVKFKVKNSENEYLVIWTTTPWTIAYNLGVMANPGLDYVKAKVGNEIWIVAKALAGLFIQGVADKKYNIIEEFKGDKLEGLEYEHPFSDILSRYYSKLKSSSPKIHTVVMSTEYVHTDSGTGLVHMACGCGPEDYEVGHRNGIPPWNNLTEAGFYPDDMGELSGLHAYNENHKFTEALKKRNVIVGESIVEHEYPHAQRSKKPVIFRATEQWFFKVEDMIERMLRENKEIYWVPEAAFNAFDSWLKNLRDNSITKQRYWGTPVPIWVCDKTGKYEVIGSIKELREKAGRLPEDLHKPWIDDVTYKSPFHPQGVMRRIPDILDVWVDAGSASWNCLDYPQKKELFDELFPADFILEGKDQIRGWFNLLHVASMIAFGKPSFKACYMHGFINDAQGRKMSKSLGNYILPAEVVMDYGADTLRYYMIGGTSPGIDINYNFEDMKVKHKNLGVLWNLHKYIIGMASNLGIKPDEIKFSKNDFAVEELYIFSRLHSTIKDVTEIYEKYKLNEVPKHIESLFLDLSRIYIQLTREKASRGSDEERKMVFFAVYNVLFEALKMFAAIAPFISEKIYQDMKDAFGFRQESAHMLDWPEFDEGMINLQLEKDMENTSEIVQAGLALREKIQYGVRWPLKEMIIVPKNEQIIGSVDRLREALKLQVNVKEILVKDKMHDVRQKIKADFSKLGPLYGELVPKIIAHLTINNPEAILGSIEKKGKYECKIEGNEVVLSKEHLIVSREIPFPYEEMAFSQGFIYLNKEINEQLEAEGFAREIMRRIQALRKKAGLQKKDNISLFLKVDDELNEMLNDWKLAIKDKVGASAMKISSLEPSREHRWKSKEKVKDKEFEIYFEAV